MNDVQQFGRGVELRGYDEALNATANDDINLVSEERHTAERKATTAARMCVCVCVCVWSLWSPGRRLTLSTRALRRSWTAV